MLAAIALAMHCIGAGAPTVVIENGLGETAAEWSNVQQLVARQTRVCTYDRAGYGASPPGPFPRTFAQINAELKAALEAAHERGPFVLAGHSFGGPVVRHFAETYPASVAALVLIDSVHEKQRVIYGGSAHPLTEGATGRPIPPPTLDAPPPEHVTLSEVEDSQREWSPEVFARWVAHPQRGFLGTKPLVVLARSSEDLQETSLAGDVARERVLLQLDLGLLSSNSIVLFAGFDHDMQKTIPGIVADAIVRAVSAAREQRPR